MALAQPVVEATLHLYKDVLNAFLPTPATCHYMFNLRDFAKVVQGIKLVPTTHLRDPNKVCNNMATRRAVAKNYVTHIENEI